jgi:hypothetical protein
VAESRLRIILTQAGFPPPAPYPAPDREDADPEVTALWFPDERTVIEFEPRFPFWCDESQPDPDEPDESPPAPDSSGPQPIEHCWIPWADLNDPPAVIDRVRTTFARAGRRTAVRHFNLAYR